jgi:hypothetical protein
MKLTFKLLTVLSVASLLTFSCKKEANDDPDLYVNPATIVNVSQFGWLQFDSPDHLNELVDELAVSDSTYEAQHDYWRGAIDSTYTQHQIDSIFNHHNYETDYIYTSFENSRTGFVSLRHQYDFLEDVYLASLPTNGSINIDLFPDHQLNWPGINSIANSFGEYQVGDYVVFNLPEGISFLLHEDSINSSNISEIRSLTKNDLVNATISDTLTAPTEINLIMQGSSDPELFEIVVVIGVAGKTIAIYTLGHTVDYLWGVTNDDCKTIDREKDRKTIGQHEFVCVTRFGTHYFLGHRSKAKIKHFERVNGKLKKRRADLGLKTINPYIFTSDNCEVSNQNWDKNYPNCSGTNTACYGSGYAKRLTHVTKMPKDPNNTNLHNTTSNNDTKIIENTRHTHFYYNGNIILTLYNIW